MLEEIQFETDKRGPYLDASIHVLNLVEWEGQFVMRSLVYNGTTLYMLSDYFGIFKHQNKRAGVLSWLKRNSKTIIRVKTFSTGLRWFGTEKDLHLIFDKMVDSKDLLS